MSRLIFTNLGIDLLWDKNKALSKLFPARIPSSEHLLLTQQNLGLFFSKVEDTFIGHTGVDETYLDFVNSFFKISNSTHFLKANPFDSANWIEGVKKLELSHKNIRNIFGAGFSVLEKDICELLNINFPKQHDTDLYSKLNDKTFLLEIHNDLPVLFPDSKIVANSQLKNYFKNYDFTNVSCLLKFPQSSGGAGQIRLKQTKDLKILDFIERQPYETEFNWLAQQVIPSSEEYTSFCYTDGLLDEYQHLVVKYDKNGYSYFHSTATEEQKCETLDKLASKVSEILRKQGYLGYFGFDTIWNDKGQCYIVDLNVRLCKGHLIQNAAEFFSIEDYVCKRIRIDGKPIINFYDFWNHLQKLIPEIHNRVFPIEVSGLKSINQSQNCQLELTFICPLLYINSAWYNQLDKAIEATLNK
ncbi:MAG: hypothetical protein KDC72_09425 [Bacteroidetes bacterium]|nr:hypothetical protein [Bacteroidota bacterium]